MQFGLSPFVHTEFRTHKCCDLKKNYSMNPCQPDPNSLFKLMLMRIAKISPELDSSELALLLMGSYCKMNFFVCGVW